MQTMQQATFIEDNRSQTAVQKEQVAQMLKPVIPVQRAAFAGGNGVLQLTRWKWIAKDRRWENLDGTIAEAPSFEGKEDGQVYDDGKKPEQYPVDEQKIEQFLKQFENPKTVSFRHRKTGQRIDINSTGNETLESMAKSKNARKTYFDPSYHETVDYINVEYGEFYDKAQKAGLNDWEIHIAFNRLMERQESSVNKSNVNTPEHAPLTSMTPNLMGMYHESHYVKKTKKKDDTASSRLYESEFIDFSSKVMDFGLWRAFALPQGSKDTENTMVNTLGGTMDSNIPTEGHTIGIGKIYSAIYKHFQRTMEIINIIIDKQHGAYKGGSIEAFGNRTAQQSELLDKHLFVGMFTNEEENFSTDSGFGSWAELAQAIEEIIVLISGATKDMSLLSDKVPDLGFSLAELMKDKKTFVKKFELIGTVIGLLIKKEKRLFMNFNMLNMEKESIVCLENLGILAEIEKKINLEVDKLWSTITTSLNQSGESKQISRELKGLSNAPTSKKRKLVLDNDISKRIKSTNDEDLPQLDGNRLFEDIGAQLTMGGGVPLDGYQVAELLQMFDNPVGEWVTFNGVLLKIVKMKGNLPKTSYNPNGLALGLIRRYRGG